MRFPNIERSTPCIAALLVFMFDIVALSQTSTANKPLPFGSIVSQMKEVRAYEFGNSAGSTVSSLADLERSFSPYGIAGTTVIAGDWVRYQPFNQYNFQFRAHSMDLVATLPNGGGLFSGGIFSGQIWTNETFEPGVTGWQTYAFEVRMKVPQETGTWAASWFYTKDPIPGVNDGSEIDNPEICVMKWQTEFDWTGYNHGPGVGLELYSLKSNPYTWHPGIDFSSDYHNYQTLWTPWAVFKYVDGTLVYAQRFRWTSKGPAQLGVSLGMGSDLASMVGLQPTSKNEFPTPLSVEHIKVWSTNETFTTGLIGKIGR